MYFKSKNLHSLSDSGARICQGSNLGKAFDVPENYSRAALRKLRGRIGKESQGREKKEKKGAGVEDVKD